MTSAGIFFDRTIFKNHLYVYKKDIHRLLRKDEGNFRVVLWMEVVFYSINPTHYSLIVFQRLLVQLYQIRKIPGFFKSRFVSLTEVPSIVAATISRLYTGMACGNQLREPRSTSREGRDARRKC